MANFAVIKQKNIAVSLLDLFNAKMDVAFWHILNIFKT